MGDQAHSQELRAPAVRRLEGGTSLSLRVAFENPLLDCWFSDSHELESPGRSSIGRL